VLAPMRPKILIFHHSFERLWVAESIFSYRVEPTTFSAAVYVAMPRRRGYLIRVQDLAGLWFVVGLVERVESLFALSHAQEFYGSVEHECLALCRAVEERGHFFEIER